MGLGTQYEHSNERRAAKTKEAELRTALGPLSYCMVVSIAVSASGTP